MKKVCFVALFFLILFCGCSSDVQSDVFALPQMPETHSALLDTVEQVRSEGFEFAEPRSGFNRRPLNLVDLDGDGEEEGIVFLRDVVDSYKTYIYIFEQTESVFSLFDVLEGKENEIYTVSYSSLLDGKGYEIIVKWGADEESAHMVTAYTLTSDGAEKVFETDVEQFSVSDIDGDGGNELLAVANKGGHIFAELYAARAGEMKKRGSVHLSEHNGKVIRILSGKATQSINAAFIERESDAGVITDVIAYKDGEYINLVPDGDICRIRALCADVDGDGIVELPKETDVASEGNGRDTTYIWRAVDEKGVIVPKTFTYHSFSQNWYFSMPLSWRRTVSASEQKIGSERTKISFFTREEIDSDEERFVEAPLFSVYIFSGSNRKALAAQDGRFIISEREDMIFAGEIVSDGYLGETIDENFLKSAFKTRESDWTSEILFA